MADETGANGAGDQVMGGGDSLPQVAVLVQYVKDYSFENPNAPAVYQWQAQPQTDVQVNVGSQSVGDDLHEVGIKVEITSSTPEGTAFKLDLLYGGLFAIRNVPADQLQAFLLAEAPRLLFPYVRKLISDATMEAGFPPLRLDPIDFAGLFMQRAAQQQAEALGGQAGDVTGQA